MTENKILTTREKNKLRIMFVVVNGLIAGLYVVFTFPFANIAFGPIQFRLAEVLAVLPVFSAGTIPGVTLGCFLASPPVLRVALSLIVENVTLVP